MKYKTNWIWEGNDKVNECAVKEARRILGNKKKSNNCIVVICLIFKWQIEQNNGNFNKCSK